MPDPETILEIMEDHGLELDEARKVAEFMEKNDINDPDDAVDICENR